MNFFDYFSEIEELFNKRCSNHKFLDPQDWVLIESWQRSGIPLEIVKAVINRICDRVPDPKRIHSLMYFHAAVEEEYARYLKSKEKSKKP